MITNYLTLALKVLRRKPFYTFVSLFGISFTLLILMLLTSLTDAMLGANPPMSKADRFLVMPMLERTRTETDTLLTIDTLRLASGGVRYDTTASYNDEIVSTSNGPISYSFLDKNLRDIESAVNYTFFQNGQFTDVYLDGRKLILETYYADAAYFEVLDYVFLHGQPFGEADVEQGNKVAVITDKTAKGYFGRVDASIIGEPMILGRETFRVEGIVARPISDNPAVQGDVILPVTTADARVLDREEVNGSFMAIFEAATPAGREAIKAEADFIAANYQFPADSHYDKLSLFSGSGTEVLASMIVGEKDTKKAVRLLFIPVVSLLVLFLSLPLINLINLNSSRVIERRAEIGVRKAFGADGKAILYQFLFENLVVTFIGAFIGFLLAYGIMQYINANELLEMVRLQLSPKIVGYFLLVTLLFGLLSGVLPAWRMSRLNISTALR